MNKKAIIAMFAIIFGLSFTIGIYSIQVKKQNENIMRDSLAKAHSEAAAAAAQNSSSSSKPEFIAPPIKDPPKKESKKDPEQEKVITKDGDKTDTTYIDPSHSKPEPAPPPPPKIDEEQKTKPTKPEYKPEDVAPPPAKQTTPKDGTRNDKGEIYIGGFGWVKNNGGGVDVEIIDNSGWEDSERIGH